MFGYVVLSQNATKEEKNKYRECYCGLCHVLKEKYGKIGMLSLSYDMTFLTLILSDIASSQVEIGKERCVVHPLTTHDYFTSPEMDYTSDMQLLLSYYSLLDKIKDENKGEKKKKSFEPFIEKLKEKYPRQARVMEEKLKEISDLEKTSSKDLDRLSLLFGELLGEVFRYDENSFFSSLLYLLGCNLGKFIYILDAWDDKEKDKRNNQFNPLDDSFDYDKVKEKLMDAASEAALAYEKLPLDEYNEITDNIIYSGMWSKFKNNKGKEAKKDE